MVFSLGSRTFEVRGLGLGLDSRILGRRLSRHGVSS